MNKLTIIFTAVAVGLSVASCEQEGPNSEERYGEIVRTVSYGSTMTIDFPGYQSDNSFVGYTENEANSSKSLFVANHVGDCLLKSAAVSGTDYRIKVVPTIDVFPDIITKWDIQANDIVEVYGASNCTVENGVVTVKVSGVDGVFKYEYNCALGGLKSVKVNYCITDKTPYSRLQSYLDQRFIENSGVYFNANEISQATTLAVVGAEETFTVVVNENKTTEYESYPVEFLSPTMIN